MRLNQFESIGIRAVYAWVSGIVKEPLIPPSSGAIGSWTLANLKEAKEKTVYFAMANLSRAFCYVPQAVAFFLFKFWVGFAYVIALWICHFLLVLVEKYKRKLCDFWIPQVEHSDKKPARLLPDPPANIFRPRKFETEEFYRRIGVEHFRRFAVWVMSGMTYGFTGKRMIFIQQPTRNQAVEFEKETRISETVHLTSAASVAPLVVLSWLGAPLSIALWSTFIVVGDLLLSLLQRYHRCRVWPLIERLLERKR